LLTLAVMALACQPLRNDPVVASGAGADGGADARSPARDSGEAGTTMEGDGPRSAATDGPDSTADDGGSAPGADAPPPADALPPAPPDAASPDAPGSCGEGLRSCAGRCIPTGACCTDGDCAGYACQGGACSTTICAGDHQRCGSTCLPAGRCCPSPAGRDCRSPMDNDCDGRPDSTIDGVCQCAPGSSRACNTHPGRDGVGPCRAGTQTCASGPTAGTSSWGACTGDVAPVADDCSADGPDRDCDGIKGNGATCTRTVYVYGSDPFTCGTPASTWPADLMLIDEDDPASVPNGYRVISQFRLFRAGGGTKLALYRCFNATDNYHSTGYSGCAGGATQRLLGYVSTIDGGPGWTRLAELFGRNFGPTAALRSDLPACCAPACSGGNNFVLK
jgi:hypothetical protein